MELREDFDSCSPFVVSFLLNIAGFDSWFGAMYGQGYSYSPPMQSMEHLKTVTGFTANCGDGVWAIYNDLMV